jgi:hypothetical protein
MAVPYEFVTGDKARLVEREQLVREWDDRVLKALKTDARELVDQWLAAAQLPANPGARALIKPSATLGALREFMNAKLACFEELMGQLGEALPELPAAPEPEPPVEVERAASVSAPPGDNPRLGALFSLGLSVTDHYRWSPGLPSIDEAQRREHYRWTEDALAAMTGHPREAEFRQARGHRARMAILADILGIEYEQ